MRPTLLLLLLAVWGAASAPACDPFGLPSTRALEVGAKATLDSASYEMRGSYAAGGADWTIDMQLAQPNLRHVTAATSGGVKVESIGLDTNFYFRGSDFLATQLAGNPLAPYLIAATGNGWWKSSGVLLPAMSDFTNGLIFKSTFLGISATSRTDGQSVDGVDAVELSGARADVFIASFPPYQLLRVHLKPGVTVDGVESADFRYSNVNQQFHISAPTDVVDFSNFSTLPPIYTVVLVDTSRCGSPCTVTATLKNLGGTGRAKGPSSVSFVMTDPATNQALGDCTATIAPDVGYNATTSASCDINAQAPNAAVVTATPTNPGRG